ncbi:exonuclease SbcC [Flexibacter flexilis DSM 6793]|uniref:Exonuclease SbcC n=1 Tax=Flexibacter flexilis DSM 6793 TaxID=927664 RepID=A0A1I1J3F8_9BACT|nr:AAA family ATPase [Flexibacter flexilis]SFC43129.1 exonuclease SbcC [Flexibacter flexilis DSM 6793]
MKILAIRLHNLASLEGTTTIDFTQEPLQSAGIFAITGQTGAGKSTILDALCLALFGKTPRHDKARETGVTLPDGTGQGDARNILRKGTSECFAEVDFVGVEGGQYRARWAARRAKTGTLQADTMLLTNLADGVHFPEKKKETQKRIEQLVGLSFEQFTRSVLLAQGDFTAFLKADKDEKSALLEKLTGTDIYSQVSIKIYKHHTQHSDQLDLLKARSQEIQLLDSEQKQVLEAQKTQLLAQIKELEQQKTQLESQQIWYKTAHELENGLTQATQKLELAQAQWQAMASETQLLALVESVQTAKPLLDNRLKANQQAERIGQALSQAQSKAATLAAQAQALQTQQQAAQAHYTQAQKEQQAAAEPLGEARALDALLTEHENTLSQAKAAQETLLTEQENNAKTIAAAEEKVKMMLQKIEEKNAWIVGNKNRENVADNDGLITSKLEQVGKLHQQQITQNNELLRLKKNLENVPNLSQLQAEIQKYESEIKEKQKEINALEKQVKNIDFQQLKAEEKAKNQTKELLIKAENIWQKRYSFQKNKQEIADKVAENAQAIAQAQKQLAATMPAYEQAQAAEAQAQKILEAARLAASPTTEQLRAHLTDGTPCLVCGSVHHPYAESSPVVLQIFDTLEVELKKCKTAVLNLQQQKADCEARLKTLVPEQESLQTRLATLEQEAVQLQTQWLPLAQALAVQEADLSENYWQTQTLVVSSDLEKIENQLQFFLEKQEKLTQAKEDLRQTEKQLQTTQLRAQNVESEIENLNLQINNATEKIAGFEEEIEGIQRALSKYFVSETWFDNFIQNPTNFIEQIKQFAKKWKDAKREVEDLEKQLEQQEFELTQYKLNTESIAKKYNEAVTHTFKCQKKLSDALEQRQNLFGGQPVAQVEADLRQRVSQAKTAWEQAQNRYDAAHLEQVQADQNTHNWQQQQAQIVAEIADLETQITGWCADYQSKNTTEMNAEKLAELLGHSEQWQQQTRQRQQQASEQLRDAQTVLTERQQQQEKHLQAKNTAYTEEELQVLHAEKVAEIGQVQTQRTETELLLRQNEEAEKRAGDLRQKIDNQMIVSEKWAKLNSLLGSADGKRFRQIAQEYTLDILLGYANVHLNELTSRYRLSRTKEALGLQVHDQDMGDEVRSVHSLSGGESFLVSLALALGLASLSSNRMKVESLFIDEGFGSLDPVTLAVAVDALERLHNQGRKVGIISHVQELTERFPTRIHVSKQRNGRSRVEVLSY